MLRPNTDRSVKLDIFVLKKSSIFLSIICSFVHFTEPRIYSQQTDLWIDPRPAGQEPI